MTLGTSPASPRRKPGEPPAKAGGGPGEQGAAAMSTLAQRFYLEPLLAFLRGRLGLGDDLAPEELYRRGQEAGLRLHKFKRAAVFCRLLKHRKATSRPDDCHLVLRRCVFDNETQ